MYGPSRMIITTTAIEEHKVPVFPYSKFSMESVTAFINNTGLMGQTSPVSAHPQNTLLSPVVTYRV
jgi:hypothetical protein